MCVLKIKNRFFSALQLKRRQLKMPFRQPLSKYIILLIRHFLLGSRSFDKLCLVPMMMRGLISILERIARNYRALRARNIIVRSAVSDAHPTFLIGIVLWCEVNSKKNERNFAPSAWTRERSLQ